MTESLQFLWRQRAAFHVIMGSGVCSLWGWGLIWWIPTFLMRTYNLNVGEAGAVTGHIHLIAGVLASLGTAWLFGRPAMLDPRRVCWVLAGGVGLATIPSMIAYWTDSLRVARLMFWLFIPAIYFYIGPCMALVRNLAACHMRTVFAAWSGLCGNVFNLIIAPQLVGALSDGYAGGHATDAASLRFGLLVLHHLRSFQEKPSMARCFTWPRMAPSPAGVPNLTFGPDEKTVYVTALDELDESPYRGKIYAAPNN